MDDGAAGHPGGVRNFRDLRVWQAAMELAQSVYPITRCLPHEETFGLTSQLRRAAVSVPSNIAEGHSRCGTAEYLHHPSIALASLAEVQTQAEFACRIGYVTEEDARSVTDQAIRTTRQVHTLGNALRGR